MPDSKNNLPKPTLIERSFAKSGVTWSHVGQFHVAPFGGNLLRLRRYDFVVVAIETCNGNKISEKDLRESLDGMLKDSKYEAQELCLILCVENTALWADFKLHIQTAIIVVDIAVMGCSQGFIDELSFRQAITAPNNLRLLNPFRWNSPCKDTMFFGRGDILEEILHRPSDSFAIVGPRRIGKTSLLYHLRRKLAPFTGQHYIYLNCYAMTSYEEFSQSLLRQVSPRAFYTKNWGTLEEGLAMAAGIAGERYVIALDEFDQIAASGDSKYTSIRSLVSSRMLQRRYRFIVAGYSALWSQIQDRNSYLSNLFEPIVLGAFAESEGYEFVKVTLGELGVLVSLPHIEKLLGYAGLQPWLLQMFCSQILKEYARNRSASFEILVERAIEAQEIKEHVFESVTATTSPLGNLLLSAIAEEKGNTLLALQAYLQHYGFQVSLGELQEELAILRISGAIVPDHKRYLVSSALLKNYLNEFWPSSGQLSYLKSSLSSEDELVEKKNKQRIITNYHISKIVNEIGGSGNNYYGGDFQVSKTNINISNSTVGVLNTGEIRNVESISTHISLLSESGNAQVAEALKQITQSVVQSEELTNVQRAEVLEQLEEVSKQAPLSPEKRVPSGVLKAILNGVATTLQSTANLAKIWTTWGPDISKYFGF